MTEAAIKRIPKNRSLISSILYDLFTTSIMNKWMITMAGNLEEILITSIKSKQIREEKGRNWFLPTGMSGYLFNYATAESVSKMRYPQIEMINDH